jgi:hypothetical protein
MNNLKEINKYMKEIIYLNIAVMNINKINKYYAKFAIHSNRGNL